jgi:hypothetical protein
MFGSQSIRSKGLRGKVFGNKDLGLRLGGGLIRAALCRTEKPISHESLVCVVSGSFGSVVMCTVHIFCGPEFWVKVVCHKIGIYFGPLLWKKARSTG